MLFTAVLFSCVPRKKVVFLQDENEHKVVVNNQVYKQKSHYYTEYKIREGDVLNIKVSALNHDEFNFMDDNNVSGSTSNARGGASPLTAYVVDDSGYVEMPIIGNVYLLGNTLEEAEEVIKDILDDYLIAPLVIINNVSYIFTVLGEINNPGLKSSPYRRINIFQAIAMSNDMTEFADRSKVKLLRYSTTGQVKVFYLNLLSQDILQSEAFQVMPNDMIIIPPMASKNFRRNIIPLTGFVLSTFGAVYILMVRLKLI